MDGEWFRSNKIRHKPIIIACKQINNNNNNHSNNSHKPIKANWMTSASELKNIIKDQMGQISRLIEPLINLLTTL